MKVKELLTEFDQDVYEITKITPGHTLSRDVDIYEGGVAIAKNQKFDYYTLKKIDGKWEVKGKHSHFTAALDALKELRK